MNVESIILLVIVVLGGVAVLGSYVPPMRRGGGGAALWGGVPARFRPLYVASMFLSVLGYFAVLYYLFFKLSPDDVGIGACPGFVALYPVFVLILVPSALWMPLTKRYLARPGAGRWLAVRSALFLVGLASIALVWALYALAPRQSGPAHSLAVAGGIYFAFHTFVLDGLVWAALTKRRS